MEFRCTRNSQYTANCLGNSDLSARQGYYMSATSKQEAIKIMASMFPTEVKAGFTVELK